jgi:energy-coupling factor transport system permease protein
MRHIALISIRAVIGNPSEVVKHDRLRDNAFIAGTLCQVSSVASLLLSRLATESCILNVMTTNDHLEAMPRLSVQFDPRATILAFVAMLALGLFGGLSLIAQCALTVYFIVLLAIAPKGYRVLLATGKRIVPLAGLVVLLNGVAVRTGEAAMSWNERMLLSVDGLEAGVYFAVRLVTMIVGLAALLSLTPPDAFANGVHALVRPFSQKLARRLSFYGFVAMSFLPLFMEEFERIRVAQSFRGGNLSGGIRQRATGARMILVPLVLSAIHRSEQLASVVELRDIKSRFGDRMKVLRLAPSDASFLLVSASVMIAVILMSRSG